ncbi:MAG: YHS domain-containing protein [Candidatus Methanoperedens sp.]|nr:YHS domain-containing protein [Candidatus Methanoperedens sp.]
MAIDPVCKMEMVEGTTRHKTEYKETSYYFCSAACKKAFEKKPEKYLKEKTRWKLW